MRARFFHLLLLIALPTWLPAESIRPENINAGKLVPGSTSPDRKLCLLEVFYGDTTQTSVIFATADRSKSLGAAPITTVWSTDIPYQGRTTIVWSPDSSGVAIHDSLGKHSVLEIRRLEGAQFQTVAVPDLLLAACQRWGISRERVISSGQRPTNWTAAGNITVEVSAKIKGGGLRTIALQLNVPSDGTPTIK